MVTVAKSFDAPIKVIWPKGEGFSLLGIFLCVNKLQGLGDIVIPGIFIALMLRFDYFLAKKNGAKRVDTVYFRACFIGYFIGLALTMLVLHIFKAGQVRVMLFYNTFV